MKSIYHIMLYSFLGPEVPYLDSNYLSSRQNPTYDLVDQTPATTPHPSSPHSWTSHIVTVCYNPEYKMILKKQQTTNYLIAGPFF